MAAKQLTASEAKARDEVQALMDQRGLNWGLLLQLLQLLPTLIGILQPVLGGLGGGTTPPVTPP